MKENLTFLGIETSCDETAASVVREKGDGTGEILSNVVLPNIILANIRIEEIAHAVRAAKNIIALPLTILLSYPFHYF